MGGIGSGRQRCWFAGGSTDDYFSIDVRRWKRDGLLTPHQSLRLAVVTAWRSSRFYPRSH